MFMKKVLLIALALILPVVAKAFVGNAEIEGVWYNIVTKTKTAEVIKPENGIAYAGDIIIPETIVYDGVTCYVTAIGKTAFADCFELTSISIPPSVKTIKGYAFYGCSNLEAVYITNISAWCNISFEALSVVLDYKWESNPLYYAHHLFFNGEEVKNLVIPNDVTSINDYAFYGCSNIETVSIPPSLKTINTGAFWDCTGLNAVYITDLSSWCKMELYSSPLSHAHHLFLNNKEITDLIIPDDITELKYGVFSGGSNFSTISIPQTVTEIGPYAFYYCSNIKEIVIPNSVSSIGYSAFAYCQNIESLSIPNNVNSIDSYAFYKCTGLSVVDISNTVTTIKEATFRDCCNLSKILIPNQVVKIERNAFEGCTKLSEVYIGSGVRELDYKAFGSCTELLDVYCYADIIPYNNGAFTDSYVEYATLHIKENMMNSYQSNWYEFGKYVRLPEIDYIVDDKLYKKDYVIIGTKINPIKEPTKEGHTFSGWSEIPETMPSDDVIVTGSFTVNSYNLTYLVDENEYKTYVVKYGTIITPEVEPTKEGYTFSGWSEIPETMPANDVTITGSFIVNKYKVTYIIDGEVFATDYVEYGSTIVPPTVSEKEGFTFDGWANVPETMPAHDVTVTGTFSINKHKLTYIVDGVEYKSYDIEYGATITPEVEPTKEGYTFSGWSEIPETMPAHDVTVTGTFSINSYKLTYTVDGEVYKTYDLEYGATITPEAEPTKEGYNFSGWSEVPATMPAHDVTITGSFSINSYKLTYTVDGEVYKTYDIEYGATITPEAEPTKEGYTFSGWSEIPTTMPAHDVTVTGTFTLDTGIEEIMSNANGGVMIFTIDGKRVDNLKKGMNVIRMKDGTTRKVVVK